MKYVIQYIEIHNKFQIVNIDPYDDTYELNEDELEISKELYNYISQTIQAKSKLIFFYKKDNLTEDDFKYKLEKNNISDIIYLAAVSEYKTEKYLTGLNTVDSTNYFGYRNFIRVSPDVYEFLKKHISYMQSMWIKLKDNSIKYITKIDQLDICDVEMSEADKFELDKAHLIQKTYSSLFNKIDEKTILNFFNFIIHNNALNSYGIFITDENREEQYLNIINEMDSDDESVKKLAEKKIKILAEYLDAYGALTEHFIIHKKFDSFKEKIYECETENDLEVVKKSLENEF